MRRKDREVTDFQTIVGIIEQCDVIRIGLMDGEFPYIVPLNFGYSVSDKQIEFYIHGAMDGRKYELLQKNKKCSFEMDIPLQMECIYEIKDITMRYKCIMGTASVEFLEGLEKEKAMNEYIMGRYEEIKNYEYNKTMLSKVALAKLKVLDISAKVNAIAEDAN